MNNKITPEQERIFNAIHNLVWFRITHEERYLNDIPEIDSADFHEWIYYINYRFIEYDDSEVRSIVYLNGKHYDYVYYPQFRRCLWVDEIEDSMVKDKIIEYGGEIYDGFELYDENPQDCKVLDEMFRDYKKRSEHSDNGYDDLPF